MEIEEKIKNLIEEVIKKNNYQLDEVKYEMEDNNYFLRIVIDKEGVIDIDDCVFVNNLISPILDENDPIKESYILDVSSKERGRE
ncbi:MAG: hypothetical protein PHW32_03230 [Bacilli bacterium]|nr:hypothetical protein [Bacilli bacterium]MDD4282873.1 hypothetical protein [Bacilli bacterium]MDD4718305.1 hypothetical protein [Bacilli bacterium]